MTQNDVMNQSTNSEKPPVEIVPSRFAIHTFQTETLEKKIVFQVIKMQESLMLYINDKDQMEFNDLSLAMKDRYSNTPVGTRLVGNFNEDFSKGIACRLSKKLNKVVFLSCNVEQNRLLIPTIEKRIYEEINNAPHNF